MVHSYSVPLLFLLYNISDHLSCVLYNVLRILLWTEMSWRITDREQNFPKCKKKQPWLSANNPLLCSDTLALSGTSAFVPQATVQTH